MKRITSFNPSLRMWQLLVLFFFSISTAVATTPAAASKEQMMKDWNRAKEYTKEYLDAMPADGLNFKPTPEVKSFAEQMLHIASANFMFFSAAAGIPNPYQDKDLEKMEAFKTKEALTKIVMESYDYAIKAVEGIKEEQLSTNINFFDMQIATGLAIDKAFEHQTHHRGQTTIYLRLKGVTPPAEKLF